MPFAFTFTDGYSQEVYLALNRVFVRKKPARRVLIPLLRVLLVGCGLLLLAFAAEGLIGAMNGSINAIQIVLYALLALLEIYVGLFYYTRRAKRGRKMMCKANRLKFSVFLRDERIEEITEDYHGEFQYHTVDEVIFYRDCWFIFLDERHCHILPMKNLSMGDAKALPAFLEEKTGKKIRCFGKKPEWLPAESAESR